MDSNPLQRLNSINKNYYTIYDLEKIFNLERKSLLVALTRLEKRNTLKRISRGIYQLPDRQVDIPAIATELYQPSYVSFEWALAKYGILSQIPYTVTLATPKKPKKMQIGETLCEYRRLKPDLLWGFSLENGTYIADPEKALLDQLYLVSKGKAILDLGALDLKVIRKTVYLEYLRKYPKETGKLARKLLKT